MITCNIIGCNCQGTNDKHHPMKAHEGGFTYYAAWYGPRHSSDGTVCISLVPNEAERAATELAEFDSIEFDEDIVSGMEFAHYNVAELFSAQELKKHRRDLLAGKVVILNK